MVHNALAIKVNNQHFHSYCCLVLEQLGYLLGSFLIGFHTFSYDRNHRRAALLHIC